MGYATQQQKLDYLFKKIGFTKSKTGVAEDQTSGFSGDTKKAGPNESIASPLVIPSTGVYADSQSIPSTPPTSSTSVVGIHTVGNPFRMTVDTSVANERAFVARETWGQPVSAIKGDWIDTQFGTDYLVKVHLGDPSTVSPGAAYTYLSAAGTSGKDDIWFFDYSSGVLNFNGADLDGQLAGVTTSNVYIVGYRYLGTKGIQPPSGIGTFNDLYVSGVSTFVGVGTFNSHLYVGGNLEVKGTTKFEGGTLTLGDSASDNVVFGADVDSNIIPDDDSTFDLGSTGQRWKKLWVDEISIGGTFSVGQDIETRHLLVTGISTFQGDSTFEGATSGRNVVWDKSENSLEFADNAKAVFGGSESLEIFHDSSDSYIKDVGTGSLNLTSNGRGFLFTKGGSEQIANLLTDSAVELFWDNSKKFSTSGLGVTITDQLDVNNINVSAGGTFGAFVDINSDLDVDGKTDLDDLSVSGISTFSNHVYIAEGKNLTLGSQSIIHSSSNSLNIDAFSNQNIILDSNHGGGELGDIHLKSNGTSLLSAYGHGTLQIAGITTFTKLIDANSDLDVDGKTDLDDLSVSGVSTFSDDVNLQGANAGVTSAYWDKSANEFKFIDNTKLSFGTGQDLNLYHGGTASYLSHGGTGNFYVDADTIAIRKQNQQKYFLGQNGISYLYHNGEERLRTTGIGVSVSGVGAAQTAYIEGPDEIWIDPHPYGVGTTSGIVRIRGDLYVDGKEFYVDSTTIELADHRVGIATTVGTNSLLDGGGIGIGSANILKTLVWNNSSSSLKSSENFDLLDNKVYKINGTTVLSKDGLGIGITNINGVIEQLVTKNLRVTGVSTFTGAVDADNRVDIALDLDVDGKTDLDDLSVSGVSTFSSAIDANGNLDVDGQTDLDVLNVSEKATFSSDIDVDGKTDLDDLSVAGVSTFSAFVDINSDLDVDGKTDLDDLSVAGVSTFSKLIDANSDLDVDGKTDLDDLSVSGVSTFSSTVNIEQNVSLQFGGSPNSLIKTESDAFNIETFGGNDLILDSNHSGGTVGDIHLKSNGTSLLSAYGHGTLKITGITTFTKLVDADDGLDVAGHSELDEVNVSGITTTTQLQVGTVGQTLVGINTILDEDNMASDSATALVTQQSVKAYVDSQVTAQDLDFQADSGGALSIDLDSETLGIIGTSNEIETSGSGNNVTIGLPDNVTIANKLTVTGDLDVDGKTDLDDLSVAGVSTFSANIDADGNLDVDGQTDLDVLNVSEKATFSSDIDVDGKTDLDDLSVSGVSTFSSAIDADNRVDIALDLDVDGKTDLDDLSVAGVSTFSANIDANANLDVDGQTDLDVLNVAEIATFSAFVDVNSDLDVDGKTDLDDLSVAGVSTFTALVDVNSDIDVDGQTTLDDLNVSGISTFAGIATFTSSDVYIDNNLYVGGIQINPGTGITTPSLDIDEYIRHNGDSNTRFGFPATDTFIIDTAGTERVRINHVGHTTASGTLNSQTDVQINGTSVLTTAENDAIALAIALG